jgi:hypothetical protein
LYLALTLVRRDAPQIRRVGLYLALTLARRIEEKIPHFVRDDREVCQDDWIADWDPLTKPPRISSGPYPDVLFQIHIEG